MSNNVLPTNDAGYVTTAQGQISDSGNSVTITSATSVPWTGDWYETRSAGIVRQLTTIFSAVSSGLGGTFTFEYSEDGSTASISEQRAITSFSSIRDFDLLNAGAYYRVTFNPDRALTGGESIVITTTHRTQNDGAFVRLADQEIERDNAAMAQTFAYLKAFDINGISRNLGLDIDTVFQQATPTASSLPSGTAPTIDPVLNSESNVIDSGWVEIGDNFPGGQLINVKADVALTVYLLNASDGSGNNIVGDTFAAFTTTAGSPTVQGAPFFDKFFRVVVVNASGSTATEYTIRSQGLGSAPGSVYSSLGAPTFDFFPAPLTKSITSGKAPDGTYRNDQVTGRDSDNSTSTLLTSSQTYRGNWFEWGSTGYVALITSCTTDVAGTLYIDFTDAESPTDGVDTDTDFSLSVTFAGGEVVRRITPLQSRWVRHRFVNGGSNQATFELNATLSSDAPPLVMNRLQDSISDDVLAGTVRAVIAGKEGSAYENVEVSQNGLCVTVKAFGNQVPISPLTAWETGGTSVGTSAVQIASGLTTGTKTISIKADGANNKQIHIGPNNSVSTANGYPLQAGDAVELEVNESTNIYAISSSGGQTVYWMAVNTHEDATV